MGARPTTAGIEAGNQAIEFQGLRARPGAT